MTNGVLQQTPIHRALSRQQQLLGADRELVLLTGLASVILVFVVLTPLSVLVGASGWLVVVGILRRVGKWDPLARHAYVRHLRYSAHYFPMPLAWTGA